MAASLDSDNVARCGSFPAFQRALLQFVEEIIKFPPAQCYMAMYLSNKERAAVDCSRLSRT